MVCIWCRWLHFVTFCGCVLISILVYNSKKLYFHAKTFSCTRTKRKSNFFEKIKTKIPRCTFWYLWEDIHTHSHTSIHTHRHRHFIDVSFIGMRSLCRKSSFFIRNVCFKIGDARHDALVVFTKLAMLCISVKNSHS